MKQSLLKSLWLTVLLLCCSYTVSAAISLHKLAKFNYADGQYRQALTWLDNQEDSELKAKTLVKLGLFDEASLVFEKLATTIAMREQAVFWLNQAARHFYSGEVDMAKTALLRVSAPLSKDIAPQFYYLSARLALLASDFTKFHQQQANIPANSVLNDYLAHHFILSKIKRQKLSVDDLQRHPIRKIPASSALTALSERTLLAMGLAFVEQGDNAAAISAFEQIRLQSPFIESALLGYGWALNNTQQFSKAHQVFVMIEQKNPTFYFDENALRGYAFAKQRLGHLAGANQLLESGLIAFTKEKNELIQLSQRFAFNGACLKALVVKASAANCHSATSELVELLASNSVALAKDQLSDIASLQDDYTAQLSELKVHHSRLLERKNRVNKRLEQLPLADVLSFIEQLSSQRDTLASAINTALEKRDTHFFLSEKYLKQQETIDKLYKEMVLLKRAGLINVDSQRRVDFMQRTLWWHSKSNFAKNSNSTKTLLEQLDKQITQLRGMHSEFVQYAAVVNDIDEDLSRIEALTLELKQQQQFAKQLNEQVMQSLSNQFVEHVAGRLKALEKSIINTKLSRLKIQDSSYQKQQALASRGVSND